MPDFETYAKLVLKLAPSNVLATFSFFLFYWREHMKRHGPGRLAYLETGKIVSLFRQCSMCDGVFESGDDSESGERCWIWG